MYSKYLVNERLQGNYAMLILMEQPPLQHGELNMEVLLKLVAPSQVSRDVDNPKAGDYRIELYADLNGDYPYQLPKQFTSWSVVTTHVGILPYGRAFSRWKKDLSSERYDDLVSYWKSRYPHDCPAILEH